MGIDSVDRESAIGDCEAKASMLKDALHSQCMKAGRVRRIHSSAEWRNETHLGYDQRAAIPVSLQNQSRRPHTLPQPLTNESSYLSLRVEGSEGRRLHEAGNHQPLIYAQSISSRKLL